MFAEVNGVRLYYEVSGKADKPALILIHGNGESHKIFDRLAGALKDRFCVYAVDSRGHGLSDCFDKQSLKPEQTDLSAIRKGGHFLRKTSISSTQKFKELHYADMAEDYAQLITSLGLIRPVLYGFSDGGIIGLLLAIKYPDMLGKLIVSGANTEPSALKGGCMLIFKAIYAISRSPLYRLMLTEPRISAEELNKIKVPALVTAGSGDMIRESDTRFIASNIPGAKLRIFKGENHMSYIADSDFMAKHIIEFCL
jgi:pimeloyl-ACP methyl ester carboxylesterase